MKKDLIIESLKKLLSEEVNEGKSRKMKANILKTISYSATQRRQDALLDALKSVYRKPSKNATLLIRNEVIWEIKQSQKKTYDLLQSGFNIARKGFAMSLSLALLMVTVLVPLQYTGYTSIIPPASAAYLECDGFVYLNGITCTPNEIIKIEAGDTIETKERAKATIFYSDYSIVRIEEKTQANLDKSSKDQINVEKGEIWVNSPSESGKKSVKVTTPELKAKIPQGSVGVHARSNTTELITDSAIVEVQIDNPNGKTDIVTVVPDQGAVKFVSSSRSLKLRPSQLTQKQRDWVTENRAMDQEYLKEVKKQTLVDHQLLAGVLPGGVPDYVGKLTRNARRAFVWDESVKAELMLTQLDELFSETLVLLEKEDETTALANFEVYSEKIASLMADEFDKLSVIESKIVKDKAVRLLEEHVRIVSPYDSEDKQYFLKDRINQLTLAIETNSGDTLANKMKGSATESKIAEAHKNVTEGNIEIAEALLKEASTSITSESVPENSLPLLTDISDMSNELDGLVKEIKMETVKQIKQKELPFAHKEIETDVITGTAYNPNNDDGSNDEEIVSSVVVGQAIKPDNSPL